MKKWIIAMAIHCIACIALIILLFTYARAHEGVADEKFLAIPTPAIPHIPKNIVRPPPIPPLVKKPPEESVIWLPILVYHRIDIAPEHTDSVYKSLTIEPHWFDTHLQYLRDHGFVSVSYADVIDYFEHGTPLPKRPMMINFDDGYGDNITNALPILKKHGYRATFFIATNLVGHKVYMTWEELKEIVNAGMEIGGHTAWHPNLTKSSDEKLIYELTASKEAIEKKLGVSVSAFAYPFGKYDDRVIAAVKKSGYSIARSFSTGNGISRQNFFRVPVVRVWGNLPLSVWDEQLFPH